MVAYEKSPDVKFDSNSYVLLLRSLTYIFLIHQTDVANICVKTTLITREQLFPLSDLLSSVQTETVDVTSNVCI